MWPRSSMPRVTSSARYSASSSSRGRPTCAGAGDSTLTRRAYRVESSSFSQGVQRMSVLIKGGRIVTAADDYVGDVYAENETITLIGESLDVQADKVIDATGKLVLPGAVDPHTHMQMAFGGTVTCDDFTSGSISAAFGGTTTIVDFCMQTPGHSLREALDEYRNRIESTAKPVVDIGLHIAVTDLKNGSSLEEL